MKCFESVGVGFGDCGIHEFLGLAGSADVMGFSDLWVQEGDQRSAVSLAAVALQATKRLKVGVGVTSPFRRHPQILAIETATLNELSGDRFILGLGVASGAIDNYAVKASSLAAMRDAIGIIRGLLSDDTSDFSYRGRVFSMKNPQRPLGRVSPLLMGAIGPRMLDLAGELADGAILTRRGSFSEDYLTYAVDRVKSSARKHGRDPSRLEFHAFFETFISENGNLARQCAKEILGTYTVPQLPSFVADVAKISADEIKLVKQRSSRGDLQGAISAVTDEMVEKFAVAGTPSECLEKLQRFTRTGLTAPILYIHGPDKRIGLKLATEAVLPEISHESK